LALLRMGFTVRPLLPGARCALTAPFHPCLCRKRPSAVCSLWHFPSPCGARALPGTLLCGARTFLRRPKPPAILTRTLRTCYPCPALGSRSERSTVVALLQERPILRGARLLPEILVKPDEVLIDAPHERMRGGQLVSEPR